MWHVSNCKMFSDFTHGSVKHTDELCPSLNLSAVVVIVVMSCVSNQKL